MGRKPRNDNPAVRLVAYVDADIRDEIDAEAFKRGLSVGQLLDRVWLEHSAPVRSQEPFEPPQTEMRKHAWNLDHPTFGKMCSECRSIKSRPHPEGCPGPK